MSLINKLKTKLIRLKFSYGRNKIGHLGKNVSLPWNLIIGG